MDKFELFKQREAAYSSEFEKLTKDYFTSLTKHCSEVRQLRLKPLPSDSSKNPYLDGYLGIMDSAISSIKAFLDEDNLRKDYPETFKELRENYHRMYLALKKNPKTDFNNGTYRAARDLYKGLNSIIQNAEGYDLKQLQKHQA